MTRLILFFLVTNILHATQMTTEVKPQPNRKTHYDIRVSEINKKQSEEAYKKLYGDDGDEKFFDHMNDPWDVRAEILQRRAQYESDDDQQGIQACDMILKVYPQ